MEADRTSGCTAPPKLAAPLAACLLTLGLLTTGLLMATDACAQSVVSPSTANSAANPAAGPAVTAAEPAQKVQSLAAAAGSPPAAAAPTAASAATVDNGAGEFYGPVKPAESLWSIANRMRPSKQISTEQVLVAIYRSNPRAFYGSINSLNEGAVLRVPNIAEMTVLTPAQARVELQRLWSARPGMPASGGQPLIDPLQIAPPPPATVDIRQPAPAEPAAETAVASGGDAPTPEAEAEAAAAVPAPINAEPAPTITAPAVVAAPAQTSAASRSADLQARVGQLLGELAVVVSAAAAAVSAALPAAAGLDRLFALSFLGVLALVVVLALLRRLLAGPAAARQAQVPADTAPVSPQVEPVAAPSVPPPNEPAPFAAVLAAVAETAPTPPSPPTRSPPPEFFDQAAAAQGNQPADELADQGFDDAADDPAGDPISTDEIGTKLDLARAYLEMGERLLARVLLREVLQQGDDLQRADAETLLTRLNQG